MQIWLSWTQHSWVSCQGRAKLRCLPKSQCAACCKSAGWPRHDIACHSMLGGYILAETFLGAFLSLHDKEKRLNKKVRLEKGCKCKTSFLFSYFLLFKIFSSLSFILSIRTMGASTDPFVLGFNSFVFISISDLTLCLVICMSPILLGGNTLCLALSDSISFLKCSNKNAYQRRARLETILLHCPRHHLFVVRVFAVESKNTHRH